MANIPAPIDRSTLNRSLARALSYHEMGQAKEADENARDVVRQLRAAGILTDQAQSRLTLKTR